MSRLRVGVVGVGHLGSHHVRAWAKIEGATLVGGFDPDPVARERAERELGLESFGTLEELADRVDVVSIAAPTPLDQLKSIASPRTAVRSVTGVTRPP